MGERKKGRYVLIGGSCSGKTTLISELKQRGFSVLEEVARQVLEERKHIPTNQKEWEARQNLIFKTQLEQEAQFSEEDLVFLDRGILDVVAYSEHFLGYVPDLVKNSQLTNRYSSIFVLDRLPFEDDGLRVESGEKEALELHNKIIYVYLNHNYKLIYVPIFPGNKKEAIKQRADFILDSVEKN
jgi:predicted ATPase